MAQHSNYAKDRDLMMEAYATVEGDIPATQSTAMPRMLNEAHCDEEHEGGETVKVELELELDKETAKKLHDQLMDEVVEDEPAEGEHPAEDGGCATHSDEEHSEDGEHYPAEDSSCASHSDEEHSEDYEMEDGEHHPAEDGSCATHSDEEHEDGEHEDGEHEDGEHKKHEEDEEVVAESYTARYLDK